MAVNILKSRLPKEYQEVEWIKSNDNAYIDANITITSDIGFEVTANIPTGTNGVILGNYLPGNYFFFVYSYPDNAMTFFPSKNASTVSMTVARDTKTTFSFKNGVLDDGTTQTTVSTYATAEIGQPIYLFSGRTNNWFASFTLYRCKIYNGSTVVKDLIPCYRKADGEIGLYDLITENFYSNANSVGSFTKGNDVDNYKIQQCKVNILTQDSGSNLPDEYQEVEYIQMDSSSPCTTGILLNINYTEVAEIRVKYEMLNEVSSMGNPMILCAHLANSFTSTTPYVCANEASSGSLFNTNYTTRDDINNPKEFIINARNASSGLIKIGGWNDDYWTAVGRYYYVNILDSNYVTIMKLIPCYRISDSVAGLYDMQNNQFYTNAGTGTFSVGNDIPKYKIQPVKMNILKETDNLLKLKRTEWNSTSYQPTSTVVFDYNKLYYMAGSGYIRPYAPELNETITRNYVTFTQTTSSWCGIGFPFEVKPNTKYTIGAKRLDGNKTKIIYALYNADGSFASYAQVTTNTGILDMSLTITTGANTKTMIIVVAGLTQGDTVYAYDIQVEEGQTRTDFKPYGYEIIKI